MKLNLIIDLTMIWIQRIVRDYVVIYNIWVILISMYLAQHISNKLETGSLVQFGDPLQYGVIKKIFTPADTLVETAEVETVSEPILSHVVLYFFVLGKQSTEEDSTC